ncbi:hypothetical protein RCG23_13655 [Neobacillus sp. PS3-34]|uniref:hypothetical protein n=1 Tax=Neobacillus sp. PS3-34 TaxID=3070678 RepID=UPI0027E03197|nr:hypothetical protein [Neobacillus sp. PS3-34]WML46694.1 hypothetical protein RCG23_13655 [Neobacillus sp. PS3-34]
MGLIRDFSRLAGKATGIVMGGPIQVIGELTGIEVIEEIGIGVRKASEFTGDTFGQAASGVVDTVSGIIKDNPEQRDKGLGDMGGAVGRTAKGVFYSAKNIIHNGGEVIGGIVDGDTDRLKKGATSIVKSVAVGAIAIGVVDLIDGIDVAEAADGVDLTDAHDGMDMADHHVSYTEDAANHGNYDHSDLVEHIHTRNEGLAGTVDPDTGVQFEEKVVELPDGHEISGVFPEFNVEYEVELAKACTCKVTMFNFPMPIMTCMKQYSLTPI